ncbi:unnamed protein product [Nezara viridula]|uniref:Cilia- and flagella-associated protein 69 ARM repeats domain-containing protein n=1 Tax=Nezara viridula TaxID=85310 RepID=A0A9P0HM19_NEZVI|nr:unnamed protein product [Nezara viridula]
MPLESDTKISNSFLISACDFTWQCIILNEVTKDAFFEDLGVYSIFNVMEDAPFIVQVLFLSICSDLCVEPKSLPQIVTWRGKERNNSFYKIICDLWRKQEKIKGVLRDEYGSIEEIEYALMGEIQRSETKSENLDISSSPAIVDLIGCARPKIALAIHLITRRHFEKVELAASVYNVPFEDAITPEDQVKTGRDAHIISIKRKKESTRISFYDEDIKDETSSGSISLK